MQIPTQIRGTVCNVLCDSPYGGAIFRLKCKGMPRTLRVIANYKVTKFAPPLGGCFAIEGNIESSDYGPQFVATNMLPVVPIGDEIVDLLGRHVAFAGLGMRRIVRLWHVMQDNLFDALNRAEIHALVRHSIPRTLALELLRAWQIYCHRCTLQALFHKHGIPMQVVPETFRFWGTDAVQAVEANPYLLTPFLSWAEIDNIGLTCFRVAFDAEIRLLGAVKSITLQQVRRGHSALYLASFKQLLRERLGSIELADKALVLSTSLGQLITVNSRFGQIVQAAGIASIEKKISKRISGDAAAPIPNLDTIPISTVEFMERSTVSFDWNRGPWVYQFLSVIKRERQCLVLSPYWLVPRIINEITDDAISILHVVATSSFRNYLKEVNPGKVFFLRELLAASEAHLALGSADIVFIHGAHALDTLTLNKVLLAIPETVALCLLGDPCCPFAIGVGAPFTYLSSSQHVREISQEGIFHSHILSGATESTASNSNKGSSESEPKSSERCPVQSRRISTESMSESIECALACYREASEQSDAIILTGTQKWANAINDALHQEQVELRKHRKLDIPRLPVRSRLNATIGDKVVFFSRDYSRALLPGDRGIIIDIYEHPKREFSNNGDYRVVVGVADFGVAGQVELTDADLEFLSLGYAIPATRTFPSKWENCIVLVEDSRVVDALWLEWVHSLTAKEITLVETGNAYHAALLRTPPRRKKLSCLDVYVKNLTVINFANIPMS